MKLIYAIAAFVGVVAAQDLNSIPACGQGCINGMLAKASEFGCSSSDVGCLCRDSRFASGLNDCSFQACGANVQAAVVSYGQVVCAQATGGVASSVTSAVGSASSAASGASASIASSLSSAQSAASSALSSVGASLSSAGASITSAAGSAASSATSSGASRASSATSAAGSAASSASSAAFAMKTAAPIAGAFGMAALLLI